MAPVERGQLRSEQSRPVLTKIEDLLQHHLHSVAPNSLLGKALHYLQGQWPKLIRYVENGAWPIDNNLCENAIRPFVVGRRNWLFADTVGGANASANLYSLIETCKANGIDPYRYLVSLFSSLPTAQTADDFEALLPWCLAHGRR
jgi:transposase